MLAAIPFAIKQLRLEDACRFKDTMSGVSFLLRIVIGVIAVGVVVGAITAGIIYYMRNSVPPGPQGPTGPAPPAGRELDMVFVNTYPFSVWIIPTFGTTTDNSPRWTNWDLVHPDSTGPDKLDVYVPHSEDLAAREIPAGETAYIPVLTSGMASVNFIFRANCDSSTMICQYGDSNLVPSLDLNLDGTRKRNVNGVEPPFKPPIDTRVEISWACAYTDGTLNTVDNTQYCTVNPSCILPGSQCHDKLAQTFAQYPNNAVIEKDGLLYRTDSQGVKIQIPFEGGQYLIGDTFFDITCVDGYTVPIVLQVKRPVGAVNSSNSVCRTSGDPIDIVGLDTWQEIANTRLFTLAECPADEVLWPPPIIIGTIPSPPVPPGGDGWNSHSGTGQEPLVYRTGPGTKLTTAFSTGTTFDLATYRNPLELTAVPSMGFTNQNIIGCASPCSFLTKNDAVTIMYPKLGGKHDLPPVYTQGSTPLFPDELGVSDVCCAAHFATTPEFDSALQCNTSKAWTKPPATGNVPLQSTDTIAGYNFGFYVADFAPSLGTPQNQPWWDVNAKTSINPYQNVASRKSRYVATIRRGASGQDQKTRAYTYQHDDAWSTVHCTTPNPAAVHAAADYRGTYYNRYRVRIVIGDGPMPPN
jgi:hypothetical protein